MHLRLISSLLLLSASGMPVAAEEPAPFLQGGSYEVAYRLELPHVERWAIDKTTTICVSEWKGPAMPVLSDNNPFGQCAAINIQQDGPSLNYDIRCSGRDAAKAHATYTLSSGDFKGRIAMVMGAKNMTMTEVQTGRRLGSCDLTRASRD
ncbi:MAG TPA: DUF3617 family protein [Xanthobacteraceae bacterium]|nr:DUF3617 family protein [Xanthobacteraceae bacterium]